MESMEANALTHLARSLERVGVQVESIDLEKNELMATMDPGDEVHVQGMGKNVAGRWGLNLHIETQPVGDGLMRLTMGFMRET